MTSSKSDIEKRVFKLAGLIGLEFPNKSKELAELKAYCEGLSLVFDDFENIKLNLDPTTANGLALGLFCDLFKIDYTLSDSEKRERIEQGFSIDSIEYTDGAFEKEIEKAGFTATLGSAIMRLSPIEEGATKDFKKLSNAIKNYITPNFIFNFGGSGITFEEWENLDFMVDDLDKIGFTFSMFNTIKTEDI